MRTGGPWSAGTNAGTRSARPSGDGEPERKPFLMLAEWRARRSSDCPMTRHLNRELAIKNQPFF